MLEALLHPVVSLRRPPANGWDPFGMNAGCALASGGVAALNHRLMAVIPSGCDAGSALASGGDRCARPPANGWDPFGMRMLERS